MSTNYYWREAPCPTCGRQEELHIGKYALGWNFSLRIYPDLGINTLDDWKLKWQVKGSVIVDEYGKEVSRDDMLAAITQSHGDRVMRPIVPRERSGEGPWDYITTEFS